MNMNLLGRVLAAASLGLVLTAAGCQSGYSAGDQVVAIWSGTSWYEGAVQGECESGYTVKWNDGTSPSCVVKEKIVSNKTLTKGEATVGTTVLAKWTGSALYEGKISSVNGDLYGVDYNDGSKKDGLTLSDFRKK